MLNLKILTSYPVKIRANPWPFSCYFELLVIVVILRFLGTALPVLFT
jgi:hypothetical protein